ncbi:hypothetical protein ENBRE01_1194 [Enteropsectra breve]|nr:hypothetical protein ENBRE01_1194 [Enteropsectra breve]
MFLSPANEATLKAAFAAEDKEKEIKKIVAKIESERKKMSMGFNTDYLDVIKKCTDLEELNDTMEEIMVHSTEFMSEIGETQMRQKQALEEYRAVEKAYSRLKIVQSGFLQVSEYLEIANALEGKIESMQDHNAVRENKFLYYEIVTGLLEIREIKAKLKCYNFYRVVDSSYRELKEKFLDVLKNNLVAWLEDVNFVIVGQEIAGTEGISKYGVFDKFLVFRKRLLNTEFLNMAYAVKNLDEKEKITVLLNKKLHELLQTPSSRNGRTLPNLSKSNLSKTQLSPPLSAVKQTQDIIYFYITFLILCDALSEHFPEINKLHEEVMDALDETEIGDLAVLVPLKRTVEALGIEPARVDTIVEKFIFGYFNKLETDGSFYKNLHSFIDKSITILNDLSEYTEELDEMLARKIDDALVKHIREKGEYCSYKKIKEIVDFLVERKPFLAGYEFLSLKDFSTRNKDYAEEKIKEIRKVAAKHSIKTVVEKIIEVRSELNVNDETAAYIREVLLENSKGLIKNDDDRALFEDTLKRHM